MARPDPKRFTFDKPDGTPSAPMGLPKVLEAAARNLKVGKGAFTVTRGGQYHHPGLSRSRALTMLRSILRSVPIGSGAVVRDGAGDRVFHATRLATVPYLNPFRDVAGLLPERIDAGVDYDGHGPVYALGDAVIVNVGTPSNTTTFGADMAVYQLLDGPAKGRFVFFAEHYDTASGLHDGMRVDAQTVLYHMTGPIEIGWSDGRGAMAWDIDGSIDGERTVWGQNFSDLLEATGCLPGLVLGRPLTMQLSAGWPREWVL